MSNVTPLSTVAPPPSTTQEALLAVIRRAKSSHIRWRAYAQGLVAGVPVSDDVAPVQHIDCQFGHWYYGEGQRWLGHLSIFQDIQGPHELLHLVYAQIHRLVEHRRHEEAAWKLEELVGISKTLIEQLDLLEQEVHALV